MTGVISFLIALMGCYFCKCVIFTLVIMVKCCRYKIILVLL